MNKTTLNLKLNTKDINEANRFIKEGYHSDLEYLMNVAFVSYLMQLRQQKAMELQQ